MKSTQTKFVFKDNNIETELCEDFDEMEYDDFEEIHIEKFEGDHKCPLCGFEWDD